MKIICPKCKAENGFISIDRETIVTLCVLVTVCKDCKQQIDVIKLFDDLNKVKEEKETWLK